MAVATTLSHVNRALDFFNKTSVYFGLGRETPWAGENDKDFLPPAPSPYATVLDEPRGYKKAYSKYLVIPDVNGTIKYRDSSWTIVSPEQAYEKKSKWVYLDCYILYDEFPLFSYRQIGVFTGLKIANGVPTGKSALLPSEVSNPGILEMIDNRKETERQSDQKEQLSVIIEF